MTNDTMTALDLLTLADHASAKSDRWLIVALLIVFIAAAIWAARWMANQNAKAFAVWREDMKTMQAEIASLNVERVKLTERFADELRTIIHQQGEEAKLMLRAHSEVLVKNAEVMSLINVALRDLQSSCAIARAGWHFTRSAPGNPPGPVPASPTAG